MKKERIRIITALFFPLAFVLLCWFILGAEVYLGGDWYQYGVSPRRISGLRGILFSPFLHGSWHHLFSNSIPIIVLGSTLFYFYKEIVLELIVWMWLADGLLLWIIGQPGSYHIGASGVVYSLAFFLLLSGFIRKNKSLLAISLIVITFYGYLVWGVFPLDPTVSWEGHLTGLLVGLVLAFYFRDKGPENDPKKVWDDSDLDGIEPYWEIPEEEQKEVKVEEGARPINIRYTYIRKSEVKKPEDD